jgi:Predicted membrane protein
MNNKTLRIAVISLMAALSYISFTFLQIKIPTPGGFTSFHLGNTFCVLAALLLGGVPGGLAGAIGMGIGDILDPIYITHTPKTVILKLGIGVIVGLVAHNVMHITKKEEPKSIFLTALISSSSGMLFNIIFSPIVGYFYNRFIFGISVEASSILAGWSTITTTVNALMTVICATLIYVVIHPKLKQVNVLSKLAPKQE